MRGMRIQAEPYSSIIGVSYAAHSPVLAQDGARLPQHQLGLVGPRHGSLRRCEWATGQIAGECCLACDVGGGIDRARIELVAEGIEFKEQATIVRAVGVDYGQGYLWHRPMPRPAPPFRLPA